MFWIKFNMVPIATIAIFVLINITSGLDYKILRAIERYAVGFLSYCPSKESRITNSSLKHISFVHLRMANFIPANRTNFNFFQMKELAKKLDFTQKTVLYMNGYMDSALRFPYSMNMGSVYAKYGYNILLLEYSWYSSMIYTRAARYLRPVGRRSAEMLAALTTYGLDPKKLELLGLSIGGHGIGYIAKHYRHLTGKNISRLTALDPAGPCFRHREPEDRIDASDADFVEVIHTNTETYGLATPIGHIDYYVNGGEFQISDNPQLPCTGTCSHCKSYSIWKSAVQHPHHFKAIKCDTVKDARARKCYDRKPLVTNLLGLNVDKNETGIYYLATTPYYPYYLGDNETEREYYQFDNINDED